MKSQDELYSEMHNYQLVKLRSVEDAIKKEKLFLKRHKLVNGKLIERNIKVINLQMIGDNVFYQIDDNGSISDLQEMSMHDLDRFYLIVILGE